MSTEEKPRLTLVFEGVVISYVTVPSRAVNIYYIILNVNFKNTSSHFVWFQNNPGEVNICVCISYSVYDASQNLW